MQGEHAPERRRNVEKLSPESHRPLDEVRWLTESDAGKSFMRKRAEKVERSFAHVLKSGRFRRTHVRGRLNILKRYLVGALCANVSLLIRKLFGFGTPKQAAAAFLHFFAVLFAIIAQDASAEQIRLYRFRFLPADEKDSSARWSISLDEWFSEKGR